MKRDWINRLKEGHEQSNKMRDELTKTAQDISDTWEKKAADAIQNGNEEAFIASSTNVGLNLLQFEQAKNTIAIDTLNVALIEILNALRDIHQLLEERKDAEK